MDKIEHSGCSCLEVFGENVDCPEHGIASEWSVENRDPEEWQGIALGLERLRAEATAALIAAARERDALQGALKPSDDTKAAYMGEFSFPLEEMDEDGNEYTRKQYVPWTTIKEIMAAISNRAARQALGGHHEAK